MSYLPRTISAEAYGAKGDGTTDDTSPLTAAMSGAGAGGTLMLTPGHFYRVTNPITVPVNDLTIYGYGAVMTGATDSQYGKFVFANRSRGRVLGLRFEGLFSSAATGLGNGAIIINASNDITVRDCEFNNIAQQGVYIVGPSARASIESNRFNRNFCAIFVDDDGAGGQPSRLHIANNTIQSGLARTSFSAGIKVSGPAGSVFDVIEGNVIDDAGEMGIEVQGPDDFTIANNTVNDTLFGISVSESDRAAINGNTVRHALTYGIEVASNANDVAVAGNTVLCTGASAYAFALNSNSRNVVVSSNRLTSMNNRAIYVQSSPLTVAGNHITSDNACVYIHNIGNVVVNGNTMMGSGTYTVLGLDATDAGITGVVFTNNNVLITGGSPNNIVQLYTPNGHPMRSVTIANNTTCGSVSFAANAYNTASSTNTEWAFAEFNVHDNAGVGGPNAFATDLDVPVWSISSTQNWPYGYYYLDGSLVAMNATDGTMGFQLPNASGIGGYTMTVQKTDSSANPVVISGWAGATVQGLASVALPSQYTRMTFFADSATNWAVFGSGKA